MDTVLSNVVGPIISKLVELAITPIGRQFGYMFYYSSNLQNLRAGVEALRGTKSRVDALVAGAERKGNFVHDEVRTWFVAVSKLNEDVESLFNEQVRCLDLKSRFQMSKKAYKMKLNHVDMLTKGEKFTEDNVSYPAPPPKFSASFPDDAVPFGSRDSIRDKILEALQKDDVKVLGLYGMGGVGKTTLSQEVAKRAEAMNLFDEILMAVVSQDPSIRNIQEQFASKLGLSLGDKESDTVRAGRLHEKLEKTGKVLVILDDLWKHLDLQTVGIPIPDKHKCCKILITTREKDVCDQMDCKNNTFPVMVLPEEEGWHLFKKMAGDCVTSAEVEPVAIEVAKECGGLPLAIVVVARALKDKIPTRWKDALRQLRASAPTNIKGMHKDVYSRLQLSYNYLDGEEIKHFFLLFSLFPEVRDISIEWPMRYGVGLGLFHQAGLGGTIQEARDKASSFVDILKSACLLLDGHEERSVRVHDVVRDFCISSLASKGQQHVFLANLGWEMTQWPEIDCTANYTAILLVDNDIKQFPHGLNCPKLKFLCFTGKNQEVNIADSFFETMKELEVLDISGVHIPLFPPSQGLLGKLRTLCLDECTLGEMEIIGNLKGLEVLSLNSSRFKDNKLPMGISLLTRLRLLDLSHCRKLLIPCGILSNLCRLEELHLEESFNEWEKENEEEFYIENSGRRERYASLSELKSSSHSLTTLKGVRVKDVRLFPKDLFFPKLTSFQIQIGDDLVNDKNYSDWRAGLKVDFKGSSIAKDHGICSLMKKCDYLQLSQMGKMKRILYHIIRDLKMLVVEKSDKIEEIIIIEEGEAVLPQLKCLRLYGLPKLASFCNVRQSRKPIQSQSLFSDKVVFPCLEELKLQKLDEVENIWHSELPIHSFLLLKELTVSDCNSLTSLFQPLIVKRLVNLEKLKVESCVEMKEIVGEEEEEETEKVILFPKVKRLKLRELPKLTSFRKGDYQLKWQKCQNAVCKNCGGGTETIAPTSQNNFGCPYFQPLFNHKFQVVFPSLEKLRLEGLHEVEHIWHSQLPNESFPQLKELYIWSCEKVLKIIPAYMHPRLPKLQFLEVKYCASVEEILEQENDSTATGEVLYPYPHLTSLVLAELPKLTHAPLNAYLNLESLIRLNIESFNSLTSLFQPSIAKRLVNLEELHVGSCEEMKEIVGEEEEETKKVIAFPKVMRLTLSKLSKLTSFKKGDYQLKWQQCHKTAFKNSVGGTQPMAPISQNNSGRPPFQPLFNEKVVFTCLERLELEGLHEVENIWHLQLLQAKSCASVEEIFEQQDHSTATGGELPKLTHAHLYNNLTRLCIKSCNSLTSLFQPSIAKRFVNLEKLKVESCKGMKEIVGEEEEEETKKVITFPKVWMLELNDLPKLTSFRKGDYQLKWQKCQNTASKKSGGGTELMAATSQNNLGCPHFQPLFNHEVAFPSLRYIYLFGLKGIKQIWESQFPTESFAQLTNLWVKRCDALEAVIGKQGEEEEEEVISTGNLVFPQLQFLRLQNLQNIRCFCEDNLYTLEFPSLVEMWLIKCPKMTTFSYASTTTPNLKGIYTAEYLEEFIPMDKNINTTVKYICCQQVEGQPNSSTSKEEEGDEKDEIERDGAGCSKS